jgi:endonuclease VIII
MPEGDTIHRAAARLGAVLTGRQPEEIRTPSPRLSAAGWPERLAGMSVSTVDAHGKHLFIRFDGGLTIHSHLRMTGSWAVYPVGAHALGGTGRRRPARPAWLAIRCGEQEAVQFDGPVLELMSDTRARTDPRLAALGPDVIGETFDDRLFLRRLREDDPTRPIGDALLDQRTVAGIGNMWKAESFFAAGVDPWRPTVEVPDEQALAVVAFARERMSRAVREGPMSRPHEVYRRAGEPCPRCGTRIRQRGQWENNRLTFWCPGCQR